MSRNPPIELRPRCRAGHGAMQPSPPAPLPARRRVRRKDLHGVVLGALPGVLGAAASEFPAWGLTPRSVNEIRTNRPADGLRI